MAGAHVAPRRACRSADSRVSYLAAILLKMGGYGFLRFSLDVPAGFANSLPHVRVGGGGDHLYTSLVALVQQDMKKYRLLVSGAYGLRDDAHLRRHLQGSPAASSNDLARPGVRRCSCVGVVLTGYVRARSRPMAGWSTGCRFTRQCSWCSRWQISACPAPPGSWRISLADRHVQVNTGRYLGGHRTHSVDLLCLWLYRHLRGLDKPASPM